MYNYTSTSATSTSATSSTSSTYCDECGDLLINGYSTVINSDYICCSDHYYICLNCFYQHSVNQCIICNHILTDNLDEYSMDTNPQINSQINPQINPQTIKRMDSIDNIDKYAQSSTFKSQYVVKDSSKSVGSFSENNSGNNNSGNNNSGNNNSGNNDYIQKTPYVIKTPLPRYESHSYRPRSRMSNSFYEHEIWPQQYSAQLSQSYNENSNHIGIPVNIHPPITTSPVLIHQNNSHQYNSHQYKFPQRHILQNQYEQNTPQNTQQNVPNYIIVNTTTGNNQNKNIIDGVSGITPITPPKSIRQSIFTLNMCIILSGVICGFAAAAILFPVIYRENAILTSCNIYDIININNSCKIEYVFLYNHTEHLCEKNCTKYTGINTNIKCEIISLATCDISTSPYYTNNIYIAIGISLLIFSIIALILIVFTKLLHKLINFIKNKIYKK